MRSARLGAVVAAGWLVGAAAVELHASHQQTALMLLSTLIQPRASLRVTEQALVLEPHDQAPDAPVDVGSIDFRAAARTGGDGEVLLTVEPLVDVATLGGGPSAGTPAIDFAGTGEGTVDGPLVLGQPSLAGRWVGPGVRTGSLTFTLRGSIGPDGATVPLRFVLSTP
ncbi:MAG: hypothetical protein AB1806_14295 [Acidobacteriota bacterium]